MLDLNLASVKKMIETAKKKGYVTYDELNAVLPEDEYTSEQIEDIMAKLSEMGINVTENDEPDEEGESPRSRKPRRRAPAIAKKETAATVTTNTKQGATTAPTTPSACTCARWARSSFCPAKARSPSPSASRPAASR